MILLLIERLISLIYMKIMLIRHGYDDFEAGDTSMGRGQIIIAADVMKSSYLGDKDVRIVSSEHKRTMASAQILIDELGVSGVEEAPWLTDGTDADSFTELMNYAKIYNSETIVIAVTHLPLIEDLLEKLQKEYDVTVDTDVGYGDVYVIDTEEKSLQKMDILG